MIQSLYADIAAERFARALKQDAKRNPNPTCAVNLPPIIPHLALQPDASFLLAVPDHFPALELAPPAAFRPTPAARVLPVRRDVVQQGFSHTQDAREPNVPRQRAVVGFDAVVEAAEEPDSVRAAPFSVSSSLDQQQACPTEAATSFKTAAESLSQASFGGPQQYYLPEADVSSESRSHSPGLPVALQEAATQPTQPAQPEAAHFAVVPSSEETPESPASAGANSAPPSDPDLEMFSGRVHKERKPSNAAQSSHSSPSAASTSSKGAAQHSSGLSKPSKFPSAHSSPLQHSNSPGQFNGAHNAPLLDSNSSQGSLAQPGTASSSFARTASGRSSHARSQTGAPAPRLSQESTRSSQAPWASVQQPVTASHEIESILPGIGSREASPPVTNLPPAVAAAQARAAQAAAYEGMHEGEAVAATAGTSELRQESSRRFSTGGVVAHSHSHECSSGEQSEIVPADGQLQQQRRATVSSGVSLADQIERALHAASSSQSPTAEPTAPGAPGARPPLAPRKEKPATPVSKGAMRRTRLLEAMALIGRPLVPGMDDAGPSDGGAGATRLSPVVPEEGAPGDHMAMASSSAGHLLHAPIARDAWELGVINETSYAGSSSYTSAPRDHARSSQDSRTSSPPSSHARRGALSAGEPSWSSAGHGLSLIHISEPTRPY